MQARILVVEDDEHIADGLRFNLEAEGYRVELAVDGREAAERLTNPGEQFDLVILDLMLPEFSGFEVARRTRAAGNYVSILILTAKEESSDVVRGLEEGADDYLTKPFQLDELLARVKGLLRRQRWDGARDRKATPPFRFGELATPDEERLVQTVLDHSPKTDSLADVRVLAKQWSASSNTACERDNACPAPAASVRGACRAQRRSRRRAGPPRSS